MPSSRVVRLLLLAVAAVVAAVVVAMLVRPGGGTADDGPGDGDSGGDSAEAGAGAAGPQDDAARTIPLPDGLQPEGLTSDGDTTFFVGSLADGRVLRGDLETQQTSVLVPGQQGRVAVGMQLERSRDRLWVAGGDTGSVTAYDAESGRELGRWVVEGSGFLNDVAVTRDAVYVTDSGVQRLVVVPLGPGGRLPDADGATTLELTGELSFVPGEFNANGVRALDRDTLLLVQSNTGGLFLVDTSGGATEQVSEPGGDLAGGDGLELGDGRLFVVRGGGGDDVAVVRLRESGPSATVERVVTDPRFDVPTTATFAGGSLWTVNARFGTTPAPTTSYDLVEVDLG